MASIEDFTKLDIRVAKIIDARDHERAKKPMYVLKLDLGELGEKTVVAGIRSIYSKEELVGRKVICIANLDPKEIAGEKSEGMVLAAEDENTISLLSLDRDVKIGSKIR